MENLLTLKQIAAKLEIPESNLRYYRSRIEPYLPSEGAGRRRRYYPDSIAVFRRALDLVQEGMSLDGVYQKLSDEFPLIHEELHTPALKRKDDLGAANDANTTDETLCRGAGSLEKSFDELQEKLKLTQKERDDLAAALAEKESSLLRLEEKIVGLQSMLDEKAVILDAQTAKLLSVRADKIRSLKKIDELEEQLFGALEDKSAIERDVLKELRGLQSKTREK